MKKNNFLSYVLDNYYDEIFKALRKYILDNHESLILDRFDDATKINEDVEIEFNEIGAHVEPNEEMQSMVLLSVPLLRGMEFEFSIPFSYCSFVLSRSPWVK